MKNSKDTIENRTPGLSACIAVPLPNEPPRILIKNKNRLNPGNTCRHLVRNFVSSLLMSKYNKTETYYITVTLPVLCMGVKSGLSHSGKYIGSDRGAEIRGARSPRRLNFVLWRLIFLVRKWNWRLGF
jgi:hypothetical protein